MEVRDTGPARTYPPPPYSGNKCDLCCLYANRLTKKLENVEGKLGVYCVHNELHCRCKYFQKQKNNQLYKAIMETSLAKAQVWIEIGGLLPNDQHTRDLILGLGRKLIKRGEHKTLEKFTEILKFDITTDFQKELNESLEACIDNKQPMKAVLWTKLGAKVTGEYKDKATQGLSNAETEKNHTSAIYWRQLVEQSAPESTKTKTAQQTHEGKGKSQTDQMHYNSSITDRQEVTLSSRSHCQQKSQLRSITTLPEQNLGDCAKCSKKLTLKHEPNIISEHQFRYERAIILSPCKHMLHAGCYENKDTGKTMLPCTVCPKPNCREKIETGYYIIKHNKESDPETYVHTDRELNEAIRSKEYTEAWELINKGAPLSLGTMYEMASRIDEIITNEIYSTQKKFPSNTLSGNAQNRGDDLCKIRIAMFERILQKTEPFRAVGATGSGQYDEQLSAYLKHASTSKAAGSAREIQLLKELGVHPDLISPMVQQFLPLT